MDYVVDMVVRSTYISGVGNRAEALAWLNTVRVDGTNWTPWIKTVVHYYNGCVPGSCSVYEQRYGHYDGAVRTMLGELGEEFWYEGVVVNQACSDVPAQGRTIEETDDCFQRFGDERYWRDEDNATRSNTLRCR